MRKTTKYTIIALLMTSLIATTIPIFTPMASAIGNWTLVNDARSVKAYPNLKEYVWQKNAIMAPNGAYDKIGLHRLVIAGTTPKDVVLMLPGTYLSGQGWTSNPPTDNFTKTENYSQAIYWANRGFDIYALDYRTHFVPTNLNSTQLGFMANWGYDQWMSDIKEAVNKIKEVSGVNKIFIAGFSFGGRAAMYYSAEYWQEDIKGIILLDGGTNIKTATPTNSYNLTTTLVQENDTSKWSLETPNLPTATGVPSGWLFQKQYAAQNPGAPAQYPPGTPLTPTTNPATGKPWANITEFSAYKMNGPSSNITGGYTNVTVLSQAYADMDRYWPDRLNLEYNAINDWTNCPYVTFDFNEYYSAINLPIISFTSELFGLPRGNGAVVNTTNPDTRQTLLLGYGHMDVYCGTYSAKDVSEPVYQWMVNHSISGWSLVTIARSLKAYPSLQESIWQKNASMLPNGPYDKIGLHRLVNPSLPTKGVIVLNPGTYGSGEQLISNPPENNFTKYENNSIAIYWANRGYDVYSMDYRTHFVPITTNANQLSFMANWGWDQWISDMKEAVNKAKAVSGASKVFMAGFSFGGIATMNYATKYAQEDIRGIILLDGGWTAKNQNYPSTNTYNLTATMNQINAAGLWSYEFPNLPNTAAAPSGALFTSQFILQNPGAPANIPGTNQSLPPPINPLTNKIWSNITEWYNVVQSGPFSNTLGGYGNVTINLQNTANYDRYWPRKLYAEMGAYKDWTNCPDVAVDFDDHYKEINVPLLGFTSELFGLPSFGSAINGIANSDFNAVLLLKYGHTDIVQGTYSTRDVSQPVVEWMGNHYQPPSASAFCSVTVTTGQTWYFFAHSSGTVGPNTYQWNEGTTILTGQTSMLMPVTKTTAGTYTYTCKVTDAEGTTATSNTITLTVINK